MAKATLNIYNYDKPAPRWYRRTKRAIYLLQAGGIFSGALTRLHISSEDQLFIVGCITVGLEVLGVLLANGEEYAPADTSKKEGQ